MSEANRNSMRAPEARAKTSQAKRLAPPHGDSKSNFKGVSLHKGAGKWSAKIYIDGNQRHLGLFLAPEDAARAYDAAAYAAWGSDCYLNFPEETRKAA